MLVGNFTLLKVLDIWAKFDVQKIEEPAKNRVDHKKCHFTPPPAFVVKVYESTERENLFERPQFVYFYYQSK
jgi:hypothetical protein